MKTTLIRYIKHAAKTVTIFDVALLIIFIGLAVSFFTFFKRENTYISIRVKVSDPNVQNINILPQNEFASKFSVGDKEYNDLGEVITEVTSVESFLMYPGAQATYLTIRCKVNYNPQKKQYSLKGIPIVIGQSFSFTLSSIKFQGTVVDFPGSLSQKNRRGIKKNIVVQLRDTLRQYSEYSNIYGVPQYIVDAIQVGDEMKDSQGTVLAKVLKKDVRPVNYTALPQRIYSNLFDAYYTLEVSAYEENNLLYMFDYRPLYVGQLMPFTFNAVSILPTIISIQ